MTDRSHDGLNYGHLGEVNYGASLQAWTAQRQPATHAALEPLGRRMLPCSQDSAGPVRHASHTETRSYRGRDIVKEYPELQPAAPIISGLHADALKGGLDKEAWPGETLSVTYVNPPKRYSRTGSTEMLGRLPILALPGGSFGEEVRFHELHLTRMGWDRGRKTWLEVPKLSQQHSATWKGDDGPVRQICPLEDTNDAMSMISVRTPTAIYIIQLLFSRPSARVLSSLVARTFLTLKSSHKGTTEYVDITSNPWDGHQIAAVDSLGHWLVWEFSGTKKPKAQIVTQTPNRMGLEQEELLGNGSDKWYRILWISDEYHIVVCGRAQLELFEIGDGSVTTWRLDKSAIGTVIVHCKRSQQSADHIFVLTSTHIIVLRVLTEAESPAIETVASWQHYRDPGDMSMRVSLHHAVDGACPHSPKSYDSQC
jgi:hypothetical protein